MLVYAICHKFIFSYTDFRAGGPLQTYLDETRAARKELKKAVRFHRYIDIYIYIYI